MFFAKKITLPALLAMLATTGLMFGTTGISIAAPADAPAVSAKTPAKATAAEKATEKKEAEKKEAKTPEPVLDNVVSVSPDELVKKPHEYLGKNVKFTANFFAFSNLALDYKPAYRSSKTHLSLLVLNPSMGHVPLSELKLAMMIPKEKDPETELLAKLKDGDQVEIIGKEFSTALDEPWVEIYKLKKIGGSKDEDKKVASESDKSKTETKSETKTETKTEEKSAPTGK